MDRYRMRSGDTFNQMSCLIRIISLVLAANAVGFGQTTWQGLTFGWQLSQVKEAIEKKGSHLAKLENRQGRSDDDRASGPHFTVIDSGPGQEQWEVQPVFDLRLSSIYFGPLHFRPHIMFNSTNKLERVTLLLAEKQHNAEGMETPVLTVVTAAPLQRELSAKYGAPVSKRGVCDSVSTSDLIGSSRPVECEVVWRAEGQSISLEWSYFGVLQNKSVVSFFSMMISYRPIQSSGL